MVYKLTLNPFLFLASSFLLVSPLSSAEMRFMILAVVGIISGIHTFLSLSHTHSHTHTHTHTDLHTQSVLLGSSYDEDARRKISHSTLPYRQLQTESPVTDLTCRALCHLLQTILII